MWHVSIWMFTCLLVCMCMLVWNSVRMGKWRLKNRLNFSHHSSIAQPYYRRVWLILAHLTLLILPHLALQTSRFALARFYRWVAVAEWNVQFCSFHSLSVCVVARRFLRSCRFFLSYLVTFLMRNTGICHISLALSLLYADACFISLHYAVTSLP